MNLLIQFENTWDWYKKFPTDESWARLRESFPTLSPERPEEGSHYYDSNSHLLTDENVGVAAELNLSFRASEAVAKGGIGQMIVKLQDRIRALELDADNKAELLKRGGAVQIHVPDLVLLGYDEVSYLDDACTDMVQDHLNDGWRILAVCPPNAQRRPDYIFGRKKR